MSAHVLVSGEIFRDVERRTSKAGNAYTTATIKVRNKDDNLTQFWRVTAFIEAVQDELARLSDGDSVSVQGVLKVDTYEKDGATRVSYSVIANHVLALRQPPKAREKRQERPSEPSRPAGAPTDYRARQGRSRAEQAVNGGLRVHAGTTHAELDDDLPF